MDKNKHKKVKRAVIVIAILTAMIIITVTADGINPGSEQDPIVTQSYVELKSEQLKTYIDTLIAKINEDFTKLRTENDLKNQEITKLQADLALSNQALAGMKEEVAAIKAQLQNTQPGSASTKFQVVKLSKDKILIAGEGAEIIARSGKFTSVYGTNGGLSDVTTAKELKTGEAVLVNHLLIASRSDGRGIKATLDNSFLIIKGTYTLK